MLRCDLVVIFTARCCHALVFMTDRQTPWLVQWLPQTSTLASLASLASLVGGGIEELGNEAEPCSL